MAVDQEIYIHEDTSLMSELYITGTGQRMRVHDKAVCKGPNCLIHNPSYHHMNGWATNWRADRRMMERVCSHGVGHPDPDGIYSDSVHGCDGCCSKPENTVRYGDLVRPSILKEIFVGEVEFEGTT